MGTKGEEESMSKACRSVPSQRHRSGDATRNRESDREREGGLRKGAGVDLSIFRFF